jgi:hypothetical protein
MGNLQSRLVHRQVSKEQNVQVEGPRAVAQAGRAVPAELVLDGQQAFEQLPWRKVRLQFDDGIDETRLAGESDRLGAPERRPRG